MTKSANRGFLLINIFIQEHYFRNKMKKVLILDAEKWHQSENKY